MEVPGRGAFLMSEVPLYDYQRAPGIALLHGPRRWRFRVSEVPLYRSTSITRRRPPPLGTIIGPQA